MNNTIEFIIKMRDMMSSGVNRLGSTSQSSFSRMSKFAQDATNKNQILGMSFTELSKKIQTVENTIKTSTIPVQIATARRELESLQRMANNHPGNIGSMSPKGSSSAGTGVGGIAIGSMLGGLAQQGISQIASVVTSGISDAISRKFDKEQAITGLSTFLGKSGAQDAYKNIQKDADATPYDTASLLMVNRSLISAGLNAKEARRDAMNLANAISAVGGGNDELSRMAANMQQIKTVGKATSMDIRQFGIAGINIYEMLAKSTGKSISQVKQMEISYGDLSKALEMAHAKGGIYEGALEAQSQTQGGKWNTLKDKMGNAAVDILEAFDPLITRLLDGGVAFANNIGGWLETAKPYIDGFAATFNQIVDSVIAIKDGTGGWSDWMAIVGDYANAIWKLISSTAVKLWSLVSSIIDFVKNSEILKDIFRVITWYWEKVWALFGYFVDDILWLWENVLKPIITAIDNAYKWIKGVDNVTVKSTKTLIAPKTNDKSSALSDNKKLVDTNSASGKDVGTTVAGGGPKTINITVGKFFDNLQFTTLNSGESTDQMEKLIMECLGRVVYNGSKMI